MARSIDHSAEIEKEFKQTAIAFLRQLQRITPPEKPYALLFEISEQHPTVWPIGATEESLSRLAATYIRKGYRAVNGNDLEQLRVAERWDAPGDQMDGWYWGNDRIYEKLNSLLELQFATDYIDDDSGYLAIQRACLRALKDLNHQGAFGEGQDRDNLVVGITNVERDFENFLDELSEVNPPSVIRRLKMQFKQAKTVWDEIKRPEK